MSFQQFIREHLQNSETGIAEVYRAFFENSMVGQVVVFKNGYMTANKAYCDMLGYTEEELSRLHWTEVCYVEDIPYSQWCSDQMTLKKMDSVRVTKRYVRKDDSVFWADLYTTRCDYPQELAPYFLSTIVDIHSSMIAKQSMEQLQNFVVTFLDASQDLIALKDENLKYLLVNEAEATYHGRLKSDFYGRTFEEMNADTHANETKRTDEEVLREGKTQTYFAQRDDRVFEIRKFPVRLDTEKTGLGVFSRDVTQQRNQQELLQKMSETNRIITECVIRPFASGDEQLKYALQEAKRLTGSLYGYLYFYDEERQMFTPRFWSDEVFRDCHLGNGQRGEYPLSKAGLGGEVVRQRKPIIVQDYARAEVPTKGLPEGHVAIHNYLSVPLFENDRIVAVIGLANKEGRYSEYDVEAISALMNGVWMAVQKEEANRKIQHMAYHDYLTGLYNRRYFDETFRKLDASKESFPLGVIMGDMNGLKLYNDTFGHAKGDAAIVDLAQKMRKTLPEEILLARIGGDEFALIVERTNEKEMRKWLDVLEMELETENEEMVSPTVSISFGYGLQRDAADHLDELLREAEAYMYNRKYFSRRSTRSSAIHVIMEALFAKSEREKHHSERVGAICEAIATAMELDRETVDKIRVAGMLHDIGKIGIEEGILNKNGKLNAMEWEMMKLHPAKGTSILDNTVEFQGIAEWVMSHHERPDGLGYPKRLKGEDIPLASRIIAIADSYDAMTNERPYRKAMSREEALAELQRCAGSQFDPHIVQVFATLLAAYTQMN